MYVFVLDKNRQPLDPCHPARARELLKAGKAAVFRRYPFTIVLKDRTVKNSSVHPHRTCKGHPDWSQGRAQGTEDVGLPRDAHRVRLAPNSGL